MPPAHKQDVVVLVHGLAASTLAMWPIGRQLKRSGFRVINYGYWSCFAKIESHGQRLSNLINTLENAPDVRRIHLVTHSMGCIICRWILCQQTFNKLGRWTMLAPPNRGSHAADFPGRYFRWMMIPIDQLSESADSFVNQLPDFRTTNDIIFSIVEAAQDRVIRASSVPLDGQHDYKVVNCHHGPMPWNKQVIQYVDQFLSSEESVEDQR